MTPFTATTHEAATIARAGMGGTVAIVRAFKPQPEWIESSGRWRWPIPKAKQHGCDAVVTASREWHEYLLPHQLPLSPGKPVWVKEGFNQFWFSQDGDDEWPASPLVPPDDCREIEEDGCRVSPPQLVYRESDRAREWFKDQSWIPAITMPRWASRFTLTPETVRVCRLSEVTDDELNSTKTAPHPLRDAPADTWVMVALCEVGGVE